MTLVLSQSSWLWALQVSDRLVSENGRKFDPAANKTVLYIAPDGIASLSYTGTAYIGGVATDRWIVETLAGEKLAECVLGHARYALPALGVGLRKLQAAFQEVITAGRMHADATEMGFEVAAVGWRYRKKWARPFIANLEKKRGKTAPVELQHMRMQDVPHRYPVVYQAMPSVHAAPVWQLLKDSHRRRPDADSAEENLCEIIRTRSATVPNAVGPNCMSVFIPPPGNRYARVRYLDHDLRPELALTERNTGTLIRRIPGAAFSPWILGPQGYMTPSVLIGETEHYNGGYRIVIEAPAPPMHGIIGAMGHMTPRPVPPYQGTRMSPHSTVAHGDKEKAP